MSWMYFNTQSHSASYYNTGPYARVLLVFIFLDTPDEICFLFLTSMAHSWHTHDSLGALVTSSWHLQVMRDSLLTHDSCKTHLWLVRDSCAKCPWLIRVLTDFSFLNWTHSHEEDSFLLKKHNGTHSWLMPQAQLIRDTRVTPVWNMHDSFVAHALCWSINCGIYSWRPWLTRDSLLIH